MVYDSVYEANKYLRSGTTPATSDYTQYGWAVDSTTRIQTLGASASLPSTGTFTWSFWYRPNSISAEHYLFNKMGSQTNEYSPRLYLQTTGALKATSTTNNVGYGGQAITSNTMTTGSWNHVIVKQTGSTIYAILNDGAVASASVISGNNSGEDYQFFLDATGVDGDIKNAILYSTALSASDITALYNSGVPATSTTAGVTSNILIEHVFDSSVSTTSATNTGSLGGSASVISGTASVVGTPAHPDVRRQHFWEYFSGDAPDVNRWGFGNQDGATGNLASMSDEVDGGIKLLTGSGTNQALTMSFLSGTSLTGSDHGYGASPLRQYSPTGSVMISIWKQSADSGYTTGGLSNLVRGDVTSPSTATSWGGDLVGTYFKLRTIDASGSQNDTPTTVLNDTDFHTHKIECRTSGVDLSIDGTTAVTNTTQLPTSKLAPVFTVNRPVETMNITYCEAYNT